MAHFRTALRCLADFLVRHLGAVVPVPELDDFCIDPDDVSKDLAYGRD